MFWRKRARNFAVLGERFVLPTLDLKPRLDRAGRLRRRLGATWLERMSDPLLDPLRKRERKVRLRFARAHRVLTAHEAVVHAALDHVAVYDDALVRATQHVVQRSGKKVDDLLAMAAERQRIAQRAARLATRVESQLERDLAIFAERIRSVGKAAHLMLVRLQRYRAFVKRTLSSLVLRENQLVAQRTLLVHDEHAFEIGRELAEDRDFARWMVEPDALCIGIEQNLRALIGDLNGLEGGLTAVPDAVERLLESAEVADPSLLSDPLLGLDGTVGPLAATDTALSLPTLSEVPQRLDDGDWDALEAHELESAIVFRATSVEALGVEVSDWLASRSGTGKTRARRCVTCTNAVLGGSSLGRAHVLCVTCREKAIAGGDAWLQRVRFAPVRPDGGSQRYEAGPITRVVFESVLGWVPSAGPGDEPVTDVSWYEAIEFCNALSRRQRRRPAYRIRGESVTLRRGPTIDGWRLPERVGRVGAVREWLWGRGEASGAGERDGRSAAASPRRLSRGLRLIATGVERRGGGEPRSDRAVPDSREPDVSFRIECDGLPRHRAQTAQPTVARPKRQRSPSPTPARPRSPASARRAVQALALTVLVGGAAAAVFAEHASLQRANSSSSTARTESRTNLPSPAAARVEPPVTATRVGAPAAPAQPAETGGDDSAGDATDTVHLHLEQGYLARSKKDRKAARAHFDRAVVVAPEDPTARYEAAREAAHARDVYQAFLHLEVIREAAKEHGRARRMLIQALGEADFARLKRDRRWKSIENTANAP